MLKKRKCCRLTFVTGCVIGLSIGTNTYAAHSPIPDEPASEPDHSGWTFYLDNDRLSLTESDEGYTAGFSLTQSGRQTRDTLLSLHTPLASLNRWLGLDRESGANVHRFHSVSYGLAAFTPAQIQSEDPIPDDRPYACLVYTTSTQQNVAPRQNVALQSSLSVGLLGTDLCKAMQNLVHEAADGIEARGWQHQIADGGEPTALWRISRQKRLYASPESHRHEISVSYDAQLGWATDVGVGISWRWGRIRSPWWSFTPQQTEYAPLGTPISRYRRTSPDSTYEEAYLWAGAMIRYRLHNSLLQGQFRDSAVEMSNERMNPAFAEAWVGFTQCINGGTEFSLSIRARSPEFGAPNEKSLLWGSLALRRTF